MQEILSHMSMNGLTPGALVLDGKVHRFQTDEHDKKKSGWFCGFQNYSANSGKPFYVVRYGNFRTDLTDQYMSSGSDFSKEDQKAMKEHMAKLKKKAENERLVRQEEAATECQNKLVDLSHGMLKYHSDKKLSKDHGAYISLNDVLIPMRDITGKIWNIQKIQNDGRKFFYPGAKVDGCFHVIGELSDTIYIAEGFATAASIYEAVGKGVVCAFNAGNLLPVCKSLRSQYKDASFVVCGDEDLWTVVGGKKHNTGRIAAESAARACMGVTVFPVFKSYPPEDAEKGPSDFNDLAASEGIETVKAQIQIAKPKKHYVNALGYDNGNYFFTSNVNPQIQRMPTGALGTSAGMSRLQPMAYWENLYPGEKGGTNWNSAADDLIQQCHKRGIFRPDNVRGLGVWIDGEHVVYHRGTSLCINGKYVPLNYLKSRFIYDLNEEMPGLHPSPLTTDECFKLLKAASKIRWKQADNFIFFSGWLAVAPVCGVMDWRPHIWVTGPSGCGKSYILQNIAGPILRQYTNFFRGATTEAGMRQKCGNSTLPVLFDEFETNDDHSSDRIRSILEFARQASSDSDGIVAKGTTGGVAMEFKPRFAMMVGSVRTNLVHVEDENRFAVLELSKAQSGENSQFAELQECVKELTDEYGARLFSRMVRLAIPLRESATAFQRVIAEKYPVRVGQQYGALLAGVWMLEHDYAASVEDAREYVKHVDFDIAKEAVTREDEVECFWFLMQKKERTRLGDRTVSEMIQYSLRDNTDLEDELQRCGIRVVDGTIRIASKNRTVQEFYGKSKWSSNYDKQLSRIPGANASLQTWFHTENRNVRCVSLPVEILSKEQ